MFLKKAKNLGLRERQFEIDDGEKDSQERKLLKFRYSCESRQRRLEELKQKRAERKHKYSLVSLRKSIADQLKITRRSIDENNIKADTPEDSNSDFISETNPRSFKFLKDNLNKSKLGKISFDYVKAAGLPVQNSKCEKYKLREVLSPKTYYKNMILMGRRNDAHIKQTWDDLFPYKDLCHEENTENRINKYINRRNTIEGDSLSKNNINKSISFLRKSDKIFKLVDLQKHKILRNLAVGRFKF